MSILVYSDHGIAFRIKMESVQQTIPGSFLGIQNGGGKFSFRRSFSRMATDDRDGKVTKSSSSSSSVSELVRTEDVFFVIILRFFLGIFHATLLSLGVRSNGRSAVYF